MRYHQHTFISVITLFSILLVISSPLLSVRAEEEMCDTNLVISTEDPLKYELRGDRCEGRYKREVAGSILHLVSLTESFENYTLDSNNALRVEWTVPKAQKVHLRAFGLRQQLYYRMDTDRPKTDTSYLWSTEIIQPLEISRNELGVVGWAEYSMSGNILDVYLPLRIAQQQTPRSSQTYTVVLWPDHELTEVYISLATVSDDGSPNQFFRDWDGKALEYGYYPAERGIEFTTPSLPAPGVYYLEIGATLKSGGDVIIEHRFYHAG